MKRWEMGVSETSTCVLREKGKEKINKLIKNWANFDFDFESDLRV
jgi:hypothetical protein